MLLLIFMPEKSWTLAAIRPLKPTLFCSPALSAALPFRPALLPAFMKLSNCVTATRNVMAAKALKKPLTMLTKKFMTL